MQNLKKWLHEAEEGGLQEGQRMNLAREYLQIQILKAIYQSKYKRHLSFMGGTCLRICYDLRRYSEDLDFTLDQKKASYSFDDLNQIASRFLMQLGFEVDLLVKENKIVQKSFLRIRNIFPLLGNTSRKDQKLHIKLEVDTHPVPIEKKEVETYFVTKFDENFPILKHTDDTLFAGKILAILNRTYAKGRDYYDLIWYLKNKIPINFDYLNRGLKQAQLTLSLKNVADVLEAVSKKVKTVSVKEILSDVEAFLADPSEKDWLKQYGAAYEQLAASYTKN